MLREREGEVLGPFTRMPSKARYTRIDRILVKETAETQHESGIDETFGYSASRTCPDHKAIYVVRSYTTKERRGKDIKRIDVKLLSDPLVRKQIQTLFKESRTRLFDHEIIAKKPSSSAQI